MLPGLRDGCKRNVCKNVHRVIWAPCVDENYSTQKLAIVYEKTIFLLKAFQASCKLTASDILPILMYNFTYLQYL